MPTDPAFYAAWQGCVTARSYSQQAVDQCTTLLQHKLATTNTRAQALTSRSTLLAMNGQREAALADITGAIALNPHLAELYYLRGILYDGARRYDLALNDFDRVVRLNPNIAQAHGWRALMLQNLERHEEAVSQFNVTLAMLPDEAYYYAKRGGSLLALGRLDAAASDFEQALKRKPDQWQALEGRAKVALARGAYAQAQRDLDRLVQLFPNNADFVSRRANALFWQGRLDQALHGMNEAIRLQPTDAGHYVDRCSIRIGLRQLDQAAADCTKARGMVQNHVMIDALTGIMLLHRRAPKEALAAFERALAGAPNHAVALYGRGVIRKRQGDAAAGDADIAAAQTQADEVVQLWNLLGPKP